MTFEINSFITQNFPTNVSYLIGMNLADTDINLIKSAKEFSIINGETETFFTADCTQYKVYKAETDQIEYTFVVEVGARVNELLNRVGELETTQSEQDDIIMDLLNESEVK